MRLLIPFLFFSSGVSAQLLEIPNAFQENTRAYASEVEENFSYLNQAINDRVRIDFEERSLAVGEGALSVQFYDSSGVSVSNVAVGRESLKELFSGTGNTAVGNYALWKLIEGDSAVAVGYNALRDAQRGGNTAVGYSALSRLTTGQNNTAVGIYSQSYLLDGSYNVSVGDGALFANDRGNENVGVGYESLKDNTASQITAVGHRSLFENTTGSGNVALGFEASKSNTVGSSNTALGYKALLLNDDGDQNTAIGFEALRDTAGNDLVDDSRGSKNTAIGYQAAKANTQGSRNVSIGHMASFGITSGVDNVHIGASANTFVGASYSNTIAIGADAIVVADNEVQIGNNRTENVYLGCRGISQCAQGGGDFYPKTQTDLHVSGTVFAELHSSSDRRLKESIRPLESGLDLINTLSPVVYNRIGDLPSDLEMGLLAQEVKATLEKHGMGSSSMVRESGEGSFMSLRYNDLMAPLIKAIQELDEAASAKDAHIASLQEQLQAQQKDLESQREELLAMIQSQQKQIAQLQRMAAHQFAAN